MYIVTYKCLICHYELTRDFPDTEIWDVEFVVNDDELKICSGEMYCPECGQCAPVRIRITDDIICSLLSEKIISPYHYSNFDMWGNGTNDECFLCNGNGHLQVGKKAHKKEDMLFITPETCPLCEGKGYIDKKE